MANIEFEDFVTGLTEETTPDNAADFLVIVDTSGSDVNKVKPSNILGADLTAIKALTPSNDDVLQRKAGAWTNRTIAQLTADLAITPNATHTGEVTGSGALTVDKTAITNKTGVSAAVGDSVLISDASDSDNLKKATIQSIVDLAGGGGVAIGDTVTGATAGSVFYAGAAGILAQNNTAFKWDNTNTQLQLTAGAATKTPLLINLFAAQSADAFQVKNSSSAVVAAITKDGFLSVSSGNYVTPNIFHATDTDTGIAISPSNVGKMIFIADGTPFMGYDGVGGFQMGNTILGFRSNHLGYGGSVVGIGYAATGVLKINDGSTGAGAMQLQEMTAPTAPAANNVILFSQDNGAGKTQLMALFATGVAQQVAIEP